MYGWDWYCTWIVDLVTQLFQVMLSSWEVRFDTPPSVVTGSNLLTVSMSQEVSSPVLADVVPGSPCTVYPGSLGWKLKWKLQSWSFGMCLWCDLSTHLVDQDWGLGTSHGHFLRRYWVFFSLSLCTVCCHYRLDIFDPENEVTLKYFSNSNIRFLFCC